LKLARYEPYTRVRAWDGKMPGLRHTPPFAGGVESLTLFSQVIAHALAHREQSVGRR
jgi:hypothetical protein